MSLHVASVLILSSVKFLAEPGYKTDNKVYAIGAIMEDGTSYLDQEAINHLQLSPEYLEQEKLHQIAEIRRRTSVFHVAGPDIDLNDKVVILVDDGAATGATVIVAARSIRKRFKPKRLIIALPVAPKDIVKLLKREADIIEVVKALPANFTQ